MKAFVGYLSSSVNHENTKQQENTKQATTKVFGWRVITSTLLTLLVIPTVYEIVHNFRDWVIAKFWRRIIRTPPEATATSSASTE